jgi:3-phosphoshikimate 1-carboxyvinyltransferase
MISCAETQAEDVIATMECLTALGAFIGRNENGFAVSPVDKKNLPKETIFFPCGESGSTLRFMLPVACALGIRGAFEMKGRLPRRPINPLDEQLENHGIKLWREGDVLHCEGQLQPGDDYEIPGDISSQFISGLIMALPLLNAPSRLSVTGTVESGGYIEMTLEAAEAFGMKIEVEKDYYRTEHSGSFMSRNVREYKFDGTETYKSPGIIETEGDWSNSAYWMCAGAMPRGRVVLHGLNKNSAQGDSALYKILSKMGADVSAVEDAILVKEDRRHSIEIDARPIPDLIPVLAAIASVGSGKTTIRNAQRLRIKESDRLTSTKDVLKSLGASIQETADGLMIDGVKSLRGGTVDSHDDHRIAMMAAIASAACESVPVTINGAECVNKSYPNFWNDLRSLGKKVIEG